MEENQINKKILFGTLPHQIGHKINKENKFNQMIDLIVEGNLVELKNFWIHNNKEWIEVCFYMANKLKKEEIAEEMKDLIGNEQNFLDLACLSGNFELSQYAVSKGAIVENKSLDSAFYSGNIKLIEWIISKIQYPVFQKPLYIGSDISKINVFEWLISKGKKKKLIAI
jgi:hypothetical protein